MNFRVESTYRSGDDPAHARSRLRSYEFQHIGVSTGAPGPMGPCGPRGVPGNVTNTGAAGRGVAAITGPHAGVYTVVYTDGSTATLAGSTATPSYSPSLVASDPAVRPCYYNPATSTLVTGNRVSLEVLTGASGPINPCADVTVLRGSGVYTLDPTAYGATGAGLKQIVWESNGLSRYYDDRSRFGDGIWSPVYAIASTGSTLIVGGSFSYADNNNCNRIAAFDTSTNTWLTGSVFGSGLNTTCSALAVTGSTMIVGGEFTTAGSLPCGHLAKFNLSNNTWSNSFGTGITGVNGPCYALACTGSMVYVGGDFTAVGGVPCNRIAAFNLATNAWTFSMGSPAGLVGGLCNALKVVGQTLYCGGTFTSAGGNAGARYLAAFDLAANTWGNSCGTLDSYVSAMDSFGTDLYVGGAFTSVNGNVCNYVLKYDTLTHTATNVPHLSATLDAEVASIKVVGSHVYVGGNFTLPCARLVRFDALTNSVCATFNFDDFVYGITSIGSKVYPVGYFSYGLTEIDEALSGQGAQVQFAGGSVLHDAITATALGPFFAADFARCELAYMGPSNAWAIVSYNSSRGQLLRLA